MPMFREKPVATPEGAMRAEPCDDCSGADDCPSCVNERCSHEVWEENGGWCKCTDCGYDWNLTELPDAATCEEVK